MTKAKKILTGAGVCAVGLALAGTTFAAGGYGNANRGENHPLLTAAEQEARETEMKTKMETALSSAVSAGKLTDTQKAYIQQLQNQIHEKMIAGDKNGVDGLRDQLRTWMQSQNIDHSVMPAGPKGRGQGRH